MSLLFARAPWPATRPAINPSESFVSSDTVRTQGLKCNGRASRPPPGTTKRYGVNIAHRYDAAVSLKWDFSTLADHLGQVVVRAEADLRLEQAVYGLDAKDELTLHALLADGLRAFYDVAREVHYPSTAGRKLTHRQRCDLVLSPKGRPLRLDSAAPTLFDPADQCDPTDALWLEVKVAYQFREGGTRHGGYGAQWRTGVVEDLRKMDADEKIHEAGLVLIVFNESDDILAKDLQLFEDVLAQKEVLAGFRHVRSTPILERMGHRLCTAAVWPTIQR